MMRRLSSGRRATASQHDLKCLERRETVGLARFAGRHRSNAAAVDEGSEIGAFVGLRRIALQPHIQAEQGQRHAAAATEFAALDPR
jgi:hypothetical protein